MTQAALQYAASNSDRFLEELKALIRIPSISGISDYHPDVRRAAEWLAAHINTIGFQMGFQNGLYAFTAAVLGGIGSIPGAVVGGIVIGLVRALSSAYVGERWTGAIVFAILIVILVFRPEGLLGRGTKEKV